MVRRPSNLTKQSPLRLYRRKLHNRERITSIRHQFFEKSLENQRERGEKLHRQGKTGPRGGLGQWPTPTGKMPGGRQVPSSPCYATLLDVLPSLDGQTTFKSDETKSITT